MSTSADPTQAPRIDSLRLPKLEPGTADQLVPRADLECVGFADITEEKLSLGDARFMECRLDALTFDTADLRGSRLRESELLRVSVSVCQAWRSDWAGVRIEGARIGAFEAYESDWQSLHFVGCKLSFVNLRGANLGDVLFTDCQIEELDLNQATVNRVALPGTRIGSLDVQDSTMQNVDLRLAQLSTIVGVRDLRGVTVNPEQLSDLAPLLAAEVGITIG